MVLKQTENIKKKEKKIINNLINRKYWWPNNILSKLLLFKYNQDFPWNLFKYPLGDAYPCLGITEQLHAG